MSNYHSEAVLQIVNEMGLHARAATKLVQLASHFQCEVFIEKEGQEVNGKSIMGVLLLVAVCGSRIKIRCVGADADACLQALTELVTHRFGE